MKILTVVAYCVLWSCAIKDKPVGKRIKVDGHLILAAGGSCLITNDFKKTYQIGSNDFPESVWEFLKSQRELKDPYSMSNLSVFAHIDVEGSEYIFQKTSSRLKILNIIRIKEPSPDFHEKYLDLIEQGKF